MQLGRIILRLGRLRISGELFVVIDVFGSLASASPILISGAGSGSTKTVVEFPTSTRGEGSGSSLMMGVFELRAALGTGSVEGRVWQPVIKRIKIKIAALAIHMAMTCSVDFFISLRSVFRSHNPILQRARNHLS